jgi:hypothetical protein
LLLELCVRIEYEVLIFREICYPENISVVSTVKSTASATNITVIHDDYDDYDSSQNTFPSCLLSKKVNEERTKNVKDKMLRQISGPKRGKVKQELG